MLKKLVAKIVNNSQSRITNARFSKIIIQTGMQEYICSESGPAGDNARLTASFLEAICGAVFLDAYRSGRDSHKMLESVAKRLGV